MMSINNNIIIYNIFIIHLELSMLFKGKNKKFKRNLGYVII
jgi:hypothetical protein